VPNWNHGPAARCLQLEYTSPALARSHLLVCTCTAQHIAVQRSTSTAPHQQGTAQHPATAAASISPTAKRCSAPLRCDDCMPWFVILAEFPGMLPTDSWLQVLEGGHICGICGMPKRSSAATESVALRVTRTAAHKGAGQAAGLCMSCANSTDVMRMHAPSPLCSSAARVCSGTASAPAAHMQEGQNPYATGPLGHSCVYSHQHQQQQRTQQGAVARCMACVCPACWCSLPSGTIDTPLQYIAAILRHK
jgi:hypothetical protein